MKTKFYFLAMMFLLMAQMAFARHDFSSLELRQYRNAPIIVEMDGYRINYFATPSVVMEDLVPGDYYVRILEVQRSRWSNREVEIYRGRIRVEPGMAMIATLDPYHRLVIEHTAPEYTAPVPAPHGCNVQPGMILMGMHMIITTTTMFICRRPCLSMISDI